MSANPLFWIDPMGLMSDDCMWCKHECYTTYYLESEDAADFFNNHGYEGCEFTKTGRTCQGVGIVRWAWDHARVEESKDVCLETCEKEEFCKEQCSSGNT